jgi:hypothetical protein
MTLFLSDHGWLSERLWARDPDSQAKLNHAMTCLSIDAREMERFVTKRCEISGDKVNV